jgi:hypothetical protein
MHVVVGEGSQVERIFQIAGVADALPVFSDRGRALASMNGRPGARTREAGS